MAPHSKGAQEFKKQTIEHYKGWFLDTKEVHFMLLCYYYISNMICRTSCGAFITL
jgi:hypothetical protein